MILSNFYGESMSNLKIIAEISFLFVKHSTDELIIKVYDMISFQQIGEKTIKLDHYPTDGHFMIYDSDKIIIDNWHELLILDRK